MPEAAVTLEMFSRYAALIRPLIVLDESFDPSAEQAASLQVERGELFPLALGFGPEEPEALSARAERLIELARYPERLGTIAVVDRRDHHRPVYRPILIYAFLQSFRLLYERLPQAQFGRWEEGSRAWADLLEAELTTRRMEEADFVASRGAAAAEMAWTALGLHVAGKVFVRDAFTDLASHFFGKLTRAPGTI